MLAPVITKVNKLDYLIKYEAGKLDSLEVKALFQYLIDTGLCWGIGGEYANKAREFIKDGTCFEYLNKERKFCTFCGLCLPVQGRAGGVCPHCFNLQKTANKQLSAGTVASGTFWDTYGKPSKGV